MADTASLVVALSAQLTQFQKDMQAAGIMADSAVNNIEKKFSSMNPKVSTSFFGNLFADMASKGLSAVEDAIKDIITRFEELQRTAKYTETSLQWVYGLQQAFKDSGSSADDLNKSLMAVALQLDQIKRGNTENPLAKLFAANGINPATINSAADALARVADIVQTLKPIERIEVARSLGLPESAVSALERGGAAMKQIAEEAGNAAPNLEAIAIQAKALSSAFDSMWTSFKNMMTSSAFEMIKTDLQDLIQFFETLQGLLKGGPLGDWADRTTKSLQEMGAGMQDAAEKAEEVQKRIYVSPAKQNYTGKDPFGLNAPTTGADSYTREVNAINKQIAVMQAEAATTGEAAGAQEEYRVQLVLSEKAAQDGKEYTLELNDAIAAQAKAAGDAKQALAEHQFQLQRLNSASQQVGSALSTAFADAIVDGKKLSDVLTSLVQTLEKAAINSLVMSFFTPGAGQTSSAFANLLSGKFAGGTDFAPGGMALVGESGPELVNLPRGSQVVPNDVLRSGSGVGGAIVYSPAIDARGASVEAVSKLAQIIEADRASFASRTVATIQQARRGRIPGL